MANEKTIWEKLQAIDRRVLYTLLMVIATVSLFFKVNVPTKPGQPTKDLYRLLVDDEALPEGSTVILQSDWTQSTRGESAGQMEALLRILMRRNIKFALLSVADPQAPLVARNVIRAINLERKAKNQREYQVWEDYVNLGYFPNAEGTSNAIAANFKTAVAGRKETPPGSATPLDVFQSPVLSKVSKVEDVPVYINVTGSHTSNILIERLGGRVPFAALVTGVMGPETLNYYQSGQVKGVAIGLNGVAEMESLMEKGLVETGKPEVKSFAGETNYGRGMAYYLALHTCLVLMIVAVVVGNVAMVAARKKK